MSTTIDSAATEPPVSLVVIRQYPTDLPVLSESVSHREEPSSSEKHGEKSPPPSEEEFYPEGGREAWSVVFGSFCGMVAGFGTMNTIGTFQTYLAANQLRNYSEGQIGWIFGVYVFISFFGGIQIGPVFDATGPRWLVASGSFFLVVSLMILSVCKLYWHFMLVFGVFSGLGTSLIFTPSVASIGHWFLVNRGYAMGLATTGGSVGGIIFPLIIQSVTPKLGFGWAVRIMGFICLLLLLVSNWLIRGRPEFIASSEPALSVTPSTPSISSELPTSDGEENKPSRWKSFLQFNSKKKKRSKSSRGRGVTIDLGAFRDPRFTLTTLGIFLIEWGVFVPITYLISYSLNELHLPSAFSYQILAIMNTGSVFGRWLPGIIADKVGRFNTMILTVLFCLIIVLSLWLPSNLIAEENVGGRKAIMIIFSLLYGFGSGSGISLTPVCVGQICETREYGTKYGTCYFFVSFGTLTGIPIAGQIIHFMNGKFTALILFTAGSYAGALFFFLAARIAGGGKKWRTIY